MDKIDSNEPLLKPSRQLIFDRFTVLAPVLIIFALVFSLAAIKNIYDTRGHANAYGTNAISMLEDFIDQTSGDLSLLDQKINNQCDASDVQLLRQYVFHSPIAKEINLFNREGKVYCASNQGTITTSLPDVMLKQSEQNAEFTSIAFADSSSHDQAFVIYFENKVLGGINVLIPPEQFLTLISERFKQQHYDYQVKVLNHALNPVANISEATHYTLNFQSQRYPLTITLQLTSDSYLTHFEEHFWQVTFIAGLISFLYQAVRYYKLTRNSLAFSLKEAIYNNELELHFQPIVDIDSPRIVGSEALIRWNNSQHGAISPAIFIPLAERMQVIESITHQVFRLVTEFVEQNPHLITNQYISINLSRTLIISPKFISYLQKYAQRNSQVLPRLLLEITEDNDFSNDELIIVRENLNILKSLGFKIAMDDFGTGYSGLNFIHQHAFDAIKIDQVFIKGLSQNSAIHSVLISMVKLAKQLHMRVIAEGVETQEQVEQLRDLGIRYIQGFYYSKPLPAEDYLLKLSAQMD